MRNVKVSPQHMNTGDLQQFQDATNLGDKEYHSPVFRHTYFKPLSNLSNEDSISYDEQINQPTSEIKLFDN